MIDIAFIVREPFFVEFIKDIYFKLKAKGREVKIMCFESKGTYKDVLAMNVFDKEDVMSFNEFKKKGDDKINYCFSQYRLSGQKSIVNHLIRVSYGLGNDSMAFTKPGMFHGVDCHLCCGRYDAYKHFHDTKTYLIGLTKCHELTRSEYDKCVTKLVAQGYDESKPTILFQHTWDKGNNMYFKDKGMDGLIISDHDATAKALSSLKGSFNIIHKNHHNTHSSYDGVINISNGFSSTFLYSVASFVISDYGGSALEALMSRGIVLYMNNTDNDKYKDLNFDCKLHTLFPSFNNPQDLVTYISNHSSKDTYANVCEEQKSMREEIADFAFINRPNVNDVFLDYIIKLVNNESVEQYRYTQDDYNLDNDNFFSKYNFAGKARKHI